MPDPVECSPAAPWGIHKEVVDHACPRCGWRVDAPRPASREAEPTESRLAA